MPANAILALKEVGHSFGGLAVLRSVTFDVPEGGIIGLIGPNGSGKTTLFNIVSGYIRPLAGTITYRGASLGRESIQRRGLAGLVRTFQTPQVFEQMTVLENIMVGCTKLTRTTMLQDLLRTPAARGQMREIRQRAEAACERFQLGSLRDLPAASLTAGQRRILEIARAVVGEPRLLLLDEPSSGLNAQEIENLREWIVRLNEQGITVLLVSHDMGLMTVARTVHTLYFGEIIASGDMAAIQRDPRVREVYLGV
ncbi:MAG: ABC transporter ATP-binding protein [Rhodospirillales bacterium SCN 65-16]|nr:MAG: ABC transporter ATP-binding protein [Rhodospirillales bacterium SCN 65-16]